MLSIVKNVMKSSKKQPAWPRHWYNYPIILAGIAVQYVWAIMVAADPLVLTTTMIHSLVPYLVGAHPEVLRWTLMLIFLSTATLSLLGFCWKRNIHTILSFIPQQFIMFLCAGGAIHAMARGTFADGTVRSHAFLIADQFPALALAIFHTWAMVLILLHGEDKDVTS